LPYQLKQIIKREEFSAGEATTVVRAGLGLLPTKSVAMGMECLKSPSWYSKGAVLCKVNNFCYGNVHVKIVFLDWQGELVVSTGC